MIGHRAIGGDPKKTESGQYEFALSSEAPVERWFGMEILDHSPDAVNMSRMADGRHPLLVNHDTDQQVGVIRKAWLDGESRMVRVASDFSRAARAQEIKQDVEDNIRTLVSVGYVIDQVVEEKRSADGAVRTREMSGDEFEQEMRELHGPAFYRAIESSDRKKEEDSIPTYRVTRWTPFEASIVAVPADVTVGKGRSAESEPEARTIRASQPAQRAITGGQSMPDENKGVAAVAETDPAKEKEDKIISAVDEARKISAAELEKNRKKAIENLCRMANLDDKYRDHYVGTGMSLEEVSDDILKVLEERGKSNPQPVTKIGMTQQDAKQFSMIRAIKACADKDWSKAPFELECSRSVADKLNRPLDPLKFFVPFEVLQRPVEGRMKRDLTVASAGGGGYLVATDNVGFIEILRNRSVAFRMGARRLSGLTANITIPRQSAAATAYWLSSESTQVTESQQTFVQVALTPKTVGAYTEISRLLLLQSNPGAEGIVTDDLAQVVAIAADLAVLNGSGASGQPTGIIGTSGIGSVTGTSLAYAGILEFQTDVAASNVMPAAGGYVTTPAVAALLMARQRFSSTDTPLWSGNVWDGQVSGFPAMSSNQMPSANMLFGDWNEVVVGEWGVLEVEVNPYANFQAGIIGVRALYSMDVAVRRPFAFSLATSIT